MANLFILSSFITIIVANYLVSYKWNKLTPELGGSILFFIISVFVVIAVNWFGNLTAEDQATESIYVDKLIYFHGILDKIRNLTMIIAMFYLTFGVYKEYLINRLILFKVFAIVLSAISIIFLLLVIYSGAFII